MRLYTGELWGMYELPIAIDLDSVKAIVVNTHIDTYGNETYYVALLIDSQWMRVTGNTVYKETAKDEWRIWTNRVFSD